MPMYVGVGVDRVHVYMRGDRRRLCALLSCFPPVPLKNLSQTWSLYFHGWTGSQLTPAIHLSLPLLVLGFIVRTACYMGHRTLSAVLTNVQQALNC